MLAAAGADGWAVCPILRPSAAVWLQDRISALGDLAGEPVRTQFWLPSGRSLPPADAVLVAPATANTVNKCAAGISDSLALGMLNDAIGRGLPVVLVVAAGADRAHPAFRRSVTLLRAAGVRLLVDAGSGGGSRTGDAGAGLRWRKGLAQLRSRTSLGTPERNDLAASNTHRGP
ncbi:MAG TPA: flavoprotein [Kineosporiaceae bacterium]